MPKASEVAAELRKFADRLDASPDAVIVKPDLYFSHSYVTNAKELFMSVAKLLPRPLKKGEGYSKDDFTLDYMSVGLDIRAKIAKSETCRLVTPAQNAVYECDPILSDEELATAEA